MAWIVKIPPSPRHRSIRWQVRYQDGPHERSAGIYPTRPEALTVKHAIERGEPPSASPEPEPEPDRTTMLFGSYATQVWWPAWNSAHPRSTHTVKTKVNARILPAFGDLPLNQVEPTKSAAGRTPWPPTDSPPAASAPTGHCSD